MQFVAETEVTYRDIGENITPVNKRKAASKDRSASRPLAVDDADSILIDIF